MLFRSSIPSISQSAPSTDLQDNTQESDPDSVDLPESINNPIAQGDGPMSDPDSDSTIGAVREEPLLSEAPEILVWTLYVVY